MYWLIETEEQISYLINRGFSEAYMEVIPTSHTKHPAINDVSLVYYRPTNDSKGYMICVDHSEGLSVSKTRVNELLEQTKKIWTLDKKDTLFYFPIKSLLDVNLISPPYIQEPTAAHTILVQRYSSKQVNDYSFVEINDKTYKNLLQKNSEYLWELYYVTELPWQISGDVDKVYNTNKNIIELQEKKKFKGLSNFLNQNYLKFYLDKDGRKVGYVTLK